MSDLLPTRLWWDGRRGEARHDGVSIVLTGAPILDGLRGVSELDYSPGVVATVRAVGGEEEEDMTREQRSAVILALRAMAAAAHAQMPCDRRHGPQERERTPHHE